MHHPTSGREAGPWLDELGEVLRPAVEQVRQQPPPQAAERRSIDRALQVGGNWPFRAFITRGVLLAAAAGGLLLWLVPWPAEPPRAAMPPPPDKGRATALAADQVPIDAPPRIFVRRSRVHGAHVAADDFLPISALELGGRWEDWERAGRPDGQPFEAWVEDGSGRSLRPSSLSVEATLDGNLAETTVEHVFEGAWPRAARACLRMSLPPGAFPVNRTVQVGGEKPFDVEDEFSVPAGATVRARVVYRQLLRPAGGQREYAYWLPRSLPGRFTFTLAMKAALAREAVFYPQGASATRKGGTVTYRVRRGLVRPSGVVLFRPARD